MSRLIGPTLGTPAVPTVAQALARAASTSAGITLVSVREEESTISYAELFSSAKKLAAQLLERGIRRGDRVALVLPTGRDFLEAFFGTQLAGAVPVPLYPPVRLGRMPEYVQATARMLTSVQARLVLTDRSIKLLLGQAIELARPELGCPTVAELREASTSEAWLETTSAELALIQFSSGSTTAPKPVALSNSNLMTQCQALKELLVEREGHPALGVSWLPLYHDMGLIGCLVSAIYYPGPLVLIPPEAFLARPALWLRAISRHRGTISPAPNFAYGLCLKRIDDDDVKGLNLSSWSYALNGAEPVSSQVMKRFCQRFAPVGFQPQSLMPVYGMSEASLAVTFTPALEEKRVLQVDAEALAATGDVREGGRTIVSVGVPVPGAEVEVRDEAGTALGERKVGRVWAHGPFVMAGYFGNTEATAAAIQNGWLDTGDLGFLDGGQLFICGRAKDLVIIRGANHSPQEFEDALSEVEGVRTGCAVALGFHPRDGADESLLLLVETSGTVPETLAEQISSAVVARTGIKPHTVVLLRPGTLPRTSSGKLRRTEAMRRFIARTLDAPESVNVLTMTRELMRSAVGFVRASIT